MWAKCAWSIASVVALLVMSGCEIKGTITDAETGEPIEHAEIAMYVPVIPLIHAEVYSPQTHSDSEGRYIFSHTALFPRLSVYADGHQTEERFPDKFIARTQTQNFQLHSMAAVKGEWNVTLMLDGEQDFEEVFRFLEDGLHWTYNPEDSGFLDDIVPFTIDGRSIEIDDYIAFGRHYTNGHLKASLELDETGNHLTGEITVSRYLSNDLYCDPCSGTLVGTRAAP